MGHGEAALKLVAENHYDVIIMDIMMPKLDGISVPESCDKSKHASYPIRFDSKRAAGY